MSSCPDVGRARPLFSWLQTGPVLSTAQLEMYNAYRQRIAECDQQLQKHLPSLADSIVAQSPQPFEEKKGKKAKPAKNAESISHVSMTLT